VLDDTATNGRLSRLVILFSAVIVPGAQTLPAETAAVHSSASRCYSIEQKYANYGGEIGLLGSPTGEESQILGGEYRDYRGLAFGMTSTVVSQKERTGAAIPTCSTPRSEAMVVDSSIYWSPRTCAQVVHGQIRELWLRKGGVNSTLGYPRSDESSTPDHSGRMSLFEHGEIWWYPDKGAYIHEPARSK
jgi:uncharacterized protein with LGFP repeats